MAPRSVLSEVDTVHGQMKRAPVSQHISEETDLVFGRVSIAEWGILELKTCLPHSFHPGLLHSWTLVWARMWEDGDVKSLMS